MTRGRKILTIVGASILGLIVLVVAAGIIVVRTQWFEDKVRTAIVTAVEDGTGGRAEVGSFVFEWSRLRAVVRDFVIHGKEAAGQAPLFRADLLQVDLKPTTFIKFAPEIAYLLAERPQANIIVFPDGTTNVPSPKIKKPSDKSGLETVVDLAIGKFDLRNGYAAFNQRKTEFSARGENLHAQLGYDALNPHYTGSIAINPLIISSGSSAPLNVDVNIPVSLEKDKISVASGRLTTPESQVTISGTMENMSDPRVAATVNAKLALAEVKRAAGLNIDLDTARGPQFATADISASAGGGRVDVRSLRLSIGKSNLEASGPLQDPNRPGSMAFNGALSLDELGRLFKVAAQPQGDIRIAGNASLGAGNEYKVNANIDGRNIGMTSGATRLSGVSLASTLSAVPNRIEVGGLRLSAFGGDISGSGSLENMDLYRFSGNLRNFDIDTLMRTFTRKPAGYGGVVSGPVQAEGSLKNSSNLAARAGLNIAPTQRGVPLSGRLNVDYNGRGDTVSVNNSYLQLPHTRATVSGSLGQSLAVHVSSRDFADFKPLADVPIALNNGQATVDATVRGSLSDPKISGRASMTNFAVQGRRFTSLNANLDASKSGATLSNALLTRGAMQAQISGSAGLRNWKLEPGNAIRLDTVVRNADAADVMALAGRTSPKVTGALTADIHVTGTAGDPQGNADLAVANGSIEGERFDRLNARVQMTSGMIQMPVLELTSGASRIAVNATYQHAPGDLKRGSLRAHVASTQVQLATFQSLVKDRTGLGGAISLNGDLAARVQPGASGNEFQIDFLNANLSARGLQMEGRNLGDLTATAQSSGSQIQYNVDSNFAGSTIRVNGQSLLTGRHDTSATAHIANLPIERVLAFAGQRGLPVSGVFGGDVRLAGTLDDPRAEATFNVLNGQAYGERFTRLDADARYTNQLIEIASLRLADGPSILTATGSFSHPPNDMKNGQARFHVETNGFQLARLEILQNSVPGLAGALELRADGAATLRPNAAPLFSVLNADLEARGVSVQNRRVGDLTAKAATRGSDLDFTLDSNPGGGAVHGNGRVQLAGNYPLNAQLTFNNLTYSGLSALTGSSPPSSIEASVTGQIQVSGPAATPDDLRGTVRLTTLEAHSVRAPASPPPRMDMQLRNQGDVLVDLNKSVLTVRNFRLAGAGTTLAVTGAAPLRGSAPMNVKVDGNIKLDVLQAFSPDIFTSGAIVLNAAVTGPASQPAVNGKLQLQNASFNTLSAPLGINNANGAISFTGREAVVQNITANAGGGKLTLNGTAGYGRDQMRVRLQTTADRVRISYPQNVNTEFNANLTLSGSTERSLLSGTVTINDLSLTSQSDVGSMLSSAAAPPATPAVRTGFLAGIRFDVKVASAPDLQVRTSLTQNLHADADLQLRGSLDHPGMLGRVNATGGEVIFFGSKYTINQAAVTFNNPQKINPILNVNLATTAQGVDVSLSVTGPMDRMKLAYQSDPPMQFSDLVSLLASGKPPTTDPVLAARQSSAPQQSFEQRGASALLGQAVANPVSGRLQRLFGVSRLKIDPQITGTSNTPQATMTLQQQISKDITFTYIQDVTQSNPQAIRVEWAIDPQWSAIAQRDRNGMFDLDFFYKKRFR